MVSLDACALLVALSAFGQGNTSAVLLDFTSDSCGPCQKLRPMVQQLAASGLPIREVNLTHQPQMAAKYRVTQIPCFVMLVGGREVDREVGLVTEGRIRQMLAKAQQTAPPSGARPLAQSPDNLIPPSSLQPPPNAQTGQMMPPSGRADRTASVDGDDDSQPVRATVRLTVVDSKGRSHGSGTVVDARSGEALVLTCGHLFRELAKDSQIFIELFDDRGQPRRFAGNLIGYDLERDLGFVSFRPDGDVPTAKVAARSSAIGLGDRVVTVGCDNGQLPRAVRSRVTAVDKYQGPANLEVAGQPAEGRSGGGLFDELGQLIGVCFAADPRDNEGVYAALDSIHAELERLQLSEVAASRPLTPSPLQARPQDLAGNLPPAMPQAMPYAAAGPAGYAKSADAAGPAGNPVQGLSAAEQATLAEIQARGQDAEVICIIRPLKNPSAKSEIIVLDRASPLFIEQLSQASRTGVSPRLTSLELRETTDARPADAVRRQPYGQMSPWRSSQ